MSKRKGPHPHDHDGEKFGRLTIIRRLPLEGKHHYVLCQCDCGRMIETRLDTVLSGDTTSCGCIRAAMGIPAAIRDAFVEGTDLNRIQCIPTSTNKTGVVGVNWDKSRSKWQASIRLQGRKIHIGRYDNFEDAVDARAKAEEKYFKPILDRHK